MNHMWPDYLIHQTTFCRSILITPHCHTIMPCSHINKLPTEILQMIFHAIDTPQKGVFKFVCRKWYHACTKLHGSKKIHVEHITKSTRLFRWAISIGYTPGRDTLYYTVENGCLDLLREVKSMHLDRLYGPSECEIAARHGHVHMLEWLSGKSMTWGEYFTYLFEIQTPEASSFEQAVLGNQFETLRWLKDNGYTPDAEACAAAAYKGNLPILKWLRRNNCPWNVRTCNVAAFYGHLELLQWARTNGCRWSTNTCAGAACGGHLDILIWLRGNGCPWNSKTRRLAQKHKRDEVLQWAIDNGCPE